jgi:hypothetical protein
MACIRVPLLLKVLKTFRFNLKRIVGVLFGVLRCPRSDVPPPFFFLLWFYIAVMSSCFLFVVF